MPALAELTKQIKEYALNPSLSDERFLNAFLLPFVTAGNITNKKQEQFYLNKSRTSLLMCQKIDIPIALRNALPKIGIKEKAIDGMVDFLEDYIDPGTQTMLANKLKELAIVNAIDIEPLADADEPYNVLPELLTELLFDSLSKSNLSSHVVKPIWTRGLSSIDVQTGDLFRFGFDNRHKKKNIVVIPVNTAFDTHITRKFEGESYPLVSENSLHGQWLSRIKALTNQFEELDDRIEKSLKITGFTPVKESGAENGNKNCYPVGSVAIIETNNAIYYLLAISEFDSYNNARSSPKDINEAIVSLLGVYDRFGLGYELYLPLMGTGLSRAGLSTPEAYELLIDSLKTNSDRIHGNVHVILTPNTMKELYPLQEE